VSCRNLVKAWGRREVIRGVSFDIEPGEIYGLLGPNGAGKTTIVEMICGLVAPDAGEVMVAGQPVGVGVRVNRLLGVAPQEIALYPQLSAWENIRYFGRLSGLRGRELRQRVDEALDTVGLLERAGDLVSTFSGGMQRRANVAVAIVHRPSLLVLDEPTVGMDPQSRNSLLETIARLATEGVGVLFASHHMDEVQRMCSRVGIIDNGVLVAEGTPRDLVTTYGGSRTICLRSTADADRLAAALVAQPFSSEVRVAAGEVSVTVATPGDELPRVVDIARLERIPLQDVRVVEPSLEHVFLNLTGRRLRDT